MINQFKILNISPYLNVHNGNFHFQSHRMECAAFFYLLLMNFSMLSWGKTCQWFIIGYQSTDFDLEIATFCCLSIYNIDAINIMNGIDLITPLFLSIEKKIWLSYYLRHAFTKANELTMPRKNMNLPFIYKRIFLKKLS